MGGGVFFKILPFLCKTLPPQKPNFDSESHVVAEDLNLSSLPVASLLIIATYPCNLPFIDWQKEIYDLYFIFFVCVQIV